MAKIWKTFFNSWKIQWHKSFTSISYYFSFGYGLKDHICPLLREWHFGLVSPCCADMRRHVLTCCADMRRHILTTRAFSTGPAVDNWIHTGGRQHLRMVPIYRYQIVLNRHRHVCKGRETRCQDTYIRMDCFPLSKGRRKKLAVLKKMKALDNKAN